MDDYIEESERESEKRQREREREREKEKERERESVERERKREDASQTLKTKTFVRNSTIFSKTKELLYISKMAFYRQFALSQYTIKLFYNNQ